MLQILLGLLFFVLPLGQLGRIPLPNASVGLYLHDLILVFLVIGFFWQNRFKKKIKISLLAKYWLYFAAACTLSFLISFYAYQIQAIFLASLYLGRLWLYVLFFICLENFSFVDKKQFLNRGLLFIGLLTVLGGFLQYLFFPSALNLTIYGWDPHYYRVFGTLLDPAYTGLILVLFLIFLLPQLSKKWTKTGFLLIVFLTYLVFALTYSRSSYLAFLAAFGVIAFLKRSAKIIIVSFILLGLTIVFLPRPAGEGVRLERTASVLARTTNWQTNWQNFSDKPFWGMGFNFLSQITQNSGVLKAGPVSHAASGADNSFLFVLSSSGLLGFTFFGLLIFTYFQKALAVADFWPKGVFLASITAILVHSLFNNSFFYPLVIIWLLVLSAFMECKKQ